MGVVYMPTPRRESQRPNVPATEYPPGTRWMSEDSTVWEVGWDNQDKRYAWFLVRGLPTAEADRAHAVSTGSPEIQLLACVLCGVVLWDIDAHYSHAHQPADPCPGCQSGEAHMCDEGEER